MIKFVYTLYMMCVYIQTTNHHPKPKTYNIKNQQTTRAQKHSSFFIFYFGHKTDKKISLFLFLRFYGCICVCGGWLLQQNTSKFFRSFIIIIIILQIFLCCIFTTLDDERTLLQSSLTQHVYLFRLWREFLFFLGTDGYLFGWMDGWMVCCVNYS